MPSHPVKALFFDVGNTLLFPNQSIICAPLHARGITPTMEQWHAIERRTKKEFDAIMAREGHADHGFWHLFYTHLLNDLEIEDSEAHHAMVTATRISANWGAAAASTREILQRLGKQYRLAVISNADGHIEALLTRHGIVDCFESITDSGMVGCEKPAERIFRVALQAMGVTPEESLYLGDVYSVDYVGARSVGMRAILFDVSGAYRENGAPRVSSLEEFEEHLQTLK